MSPTTGIEYITENKLEIVSATPPSSGIGKMIYKASIIGHP